jgi:hypothetical protein
LLPTEIEPVALLALVLASMVEPSDLERAKHFAEIGGREARQRMASSLNLGSPSLCALQDRADAARARHIGMVVGICRAFSA